MIRSQAMRKAGEPDLLVMLEDQPIPSWSLNFKLKSHHQAWCLDYQGARKDNLVLEHLFKERRHGLDLFTKTGPTGPENQRKYVADLGRKLYRDWLPAAVQHHLARVLPELETIRVLSKNPWIPWDLIVAKDRQGREYELGLDFGVAHWLEGFSQKLPRSFNRIAVLGASDPQPDFCLTGAKEVRHIPAKMPAIRDALADGYDLYHFQGLKSWEQGGNLTLNLPGAQAQDRVIDLLLRPANVPGFGGKHILEGPLVVFGGMASEFLVTGVQETQSWARTFLKAGAAAFVGCYWDCSPSTSTCFFNHFYDYLCAGFPLALAARNARLKACERDPIGGRAFTLYGDPLAYFGSTAYFPQGRMRPSRPSLPATGEIQPTHPPRQPSLGSVHQKIDKIKAKDVVLESAQGPAGSMPSINQEIGEIDAEDTATITAWQSTPNGGTKHGGH